MYSPEDGVTLNNTCHLITLSHKKAITQTAITNLVFA